MFALQVRSQGVDTMHITFSQNLADKGGRIDDSSRTWGQESIVFRMDQEQERDLKSKGEKKEG